MVHSEALTAPKVLVEATGGDKAREGSCCRVPKERASAAYPMRSGTKTIVGALLERGCGAASAWTACWRALRSGGGGCAGKAGADRTIIPWRDG